MNCSGCPHRKDKRDKGWRKFKAKNGFCPTECWSLDYHIAKFVLPRLKHFRDNPNGCPSNLCSEKEDTKKGVKRWVAILDKMIYSFEYAVQQFDEKKYDMKKVNEGIQLFAKYFFDLWD